MDLPYKAEYAKSGRSSCKGCKSAIAQSSLRIAVLVQSPVFDGKVTQWYHHMCFFSKQRPKTVDDIENFETLRLPDQEKIRENIVSGASVILPDKKGKGKKRDASAVASKKIALKDFNIEYAKSSRSTCRGCELKIMKEEIRISKKDFETEVGKKYGGQDMWHHLTCFAKLRTELGYYETALALPGFKALSKEDQKEALKQIPAIKQEDIPSEVKKPKIEEPTEEEKQYKEHLTIFHKYRDQLKKMTKGELIELLEHNGQEIPSGQDAILDRLADIMTFGALEPCKICKGGQYVYNKMGYICKGDLTEWSKCNNVTKTPKRAPFSVPKEFSKEYSFLKRYKYVPRIRIFKDVNPTVSVKKEDDIDAKPKVERVAPPLYNMEFVILGKPHRGKDELKKQIVKLGGKVVTSIHENIMAVIASEEDVEKMGSRMQVVRSNDIQVVPESFVDDAVGKTGKIPDLIIEKKICDWGSDPTTRLPPEPSMSSKSKSGKSIYSKSGPSKIKLMVKGGTAVDPDSGLEKKAHVYQEGGDKYTVVLGIVDIQQQRNSYYKLQLLKSDKGDSYWVFRSWGRTGTTIGSTKLENFPSLHLAKNEFERLYEEKSGNMWEDRHDFVKVPGKMYPIDVDYGEDDMKNIDVTDAPSTLEKQVADLMRLIFDMKQMKQTMLELELDTEKMPLGKLSKKQILSAYKVLSELQKTLESENNGNEMKFIDASNRFYTFIPHSFGIDNPPILKTPEMIKQKIEMLDSLMELEVAYSLLKSAGADSTLDQYYSKLNTEIKPISKDTDEFKIIQEYVTNTHAETHQSYELEIIDVFDVKRQGEEKRFKPFKKLHNRMLLWHGSRTTNFAGILSQGLRIAPPEAPSTGYMFGKGIYFADMVSKSANYCFTSPGNNHGLLLLCEVALGNMHELTKAKYIEKLPSGKHSTKGLGKTAPDPKGSKKLGDVEVPAGKPIKISGLDGGHLLYNEYIVYDIAQVKAKYLLKLNFKYKY